jgi:hypothetical protein
MTGYDALGLQQILILLIGITLIAIGGAGLLGIF